MQGYLGRLSSSDKAAERQAEWDRAKLSSESNRRKLEYDMQKDQRDYDLNAEKASLEMRNAQTKAYAENMKAVHGDNAGAVMAGAAAAFNGLARTNVNAIKNGGQIDGLTAQILRNPALEGKSYAELPEETRAALLDMMTSPAGVAGLDPAAQQLFAQLGLAVEDQRGRNTAWNVAKGVVGGAVTGAGIGMLKAGPKGALVGAGTGAVLGGGGMYGANQVQPDSPATILRDGGYYVNRAAGGY